MSQERDSNLLDLVKQKVLYSYEYKSDFGKFKKGLPGKENIYISLIGKNSWQKVWKCS